MTETLPYVTGAFAVSVFPEGTRSRDGAVGEFRTGAARRWPASRASPSSPPG